MTKKIKVKNKRQLNRLVKGYRKEGYFLIIKKLIAEGQEAAKKDKTEEEMAYATNYSLSEYDFVAMGFNNPDFIIGEVKDFYRIGESV